MNNRNKYPAGGFTLVEIMIVVVIVGLLSAMAISTSENDGTTVTFNM